MQEEMKVNPMNGKLDDTAGCFGMMLTGLLLWLGLLLLILCSCGSRRQVTNETKDSVRVEVKTVTLMVKDTAYVEIPVQIAERETRDSTSHLENDYAVSDASVTDGVLFHSLATKPQKKPVEVEKEVVVRDSIVYRDREVEKTITKEVEKKLNWWQRLTMGAGMLAMGGVIGLIVFYVARRRFV